MNGNSNIKFSLSFSMYTFILCAVLFSPLYATFRGFLSIFLLEIASNKVSRYITISSSVLLFTK